MKILVVQESDWIARNPHQQHHLMERLVAKGHQVQVVDHDIDWKKNGVKTLWHKREKYSDVHKIINEGAVSVYRPGFLAVPILEYPSLVFSHWRELNLQITTFRPDVIVGFGILNAYLAACLANKIEIPFVYYWIDEIDKLIPERFFRYIGVLIEKATLRRSAQVIAINTVLREKVVRLGAAADQAIIISAGIDKTRFNPSVDGTAIRVRYGIPKEAIVFLFMGWLYHFSGIKEVARILSKTDEYGNIYLLIVGDGDAYTDLQEIIEKNSSGNHIILAGKQPYEEIPLFIAASSVCLLPAYRDEPIMQDIVPIKMYEYMAVGKPVIASKLPGIYQEFGDGHGVLYVETPEDSIAVGLSLVRNHALSTEGQRAHDFVAGSSWDETTERFEKALQHLTDKFIDAH